MVMERWKQNYLRPRRSFLDLQDSDSLFSWPSHWSLWNRLPAEEIVWPALMDMYEKEDSFIVRAEMPGVKKEDLDISITGDTLSIKGERKPPADVESKEYRCGEVCYGSFFRSITIPAAIDSDNIEASQEDGIVEIRLPKAKEVKPSKIQIKAK